MNDTIEQAFSEREMAENEPRKRTHHADVFISSTANDLPAHHEAAVDAVWRCGMYPLAMAHPAAHDADPAAASLEVVDAAGVYVGIFAHRYGHIPPGGEMSIAEMEYRRAVEREIPILIFIMHEEHPVTPGNAEDDPAKRERLAALKEELATTHAASFFTSPADLGGQVLRALNHLVRGGTIKAKPAAPGEGPVDAIPSPPEPYMAYPCIMPRAFFGRRAELTVLDAWAESDDAVLVVEAADGVGKSALAWQWLCEEGRIQRRIPALAGAIWWRFYEHDADMDSFFWHALAYVTGQPVEAFEALSRDDREAALLSYLCERPYLIVFDDFERILADDQVEGEISRDGLLLQRLAQGAPSKALVISRLIPSDLEDRDTGRLAPGVRRLHVDGLDPYDALDLMYYLGVAGRDDDIDAFLRQLDYHSLLVGITAGCIRHYQPAPGDFGAWYEAEGRDLRLDALDPGGRQAGVLGCALGGLSEDLRGLLGQIAGLRSLVDFEALLPLNPYAPPDVEAPKKAPIDVMVKLHKGWLDDMHRHLSKAKTEEEADDLRERIKNQEVEVANQEALYAEQMAVWEVHQAALARFHAALVALEDRGLLLWDRFANRYDLHPVVRVYVLGQLAASAGPEAAGDAGNGGAPDDPDAAGDADAGWLSRLDEG